MPKSRLVLLISGDSPGLQAILDACAVGELQAEVAAVISDKLDAPGLDRARRARVPAIAKVKPKAEERREYEAGLGELIMSFRPDWVVLVGWARPLSATLIDDLPQPVISTHPALPDAFPGPLAVERAYYAYCRNEIEQTGVTVYRVSGEESGPILGHAVVPIYPDDTIETLQARIESVEPHLLVNVLKQLLLTPPVRS